jgi:hypothetical protein
LAVRAKPRFLSKRKSKNASPDFRPKQESEDDMDSIEIGGTEMDGGYRRVSPVAAHSGDRLLSDPQPALSLSAGTALPPHSGHSRSSSRRLEAAFNGTPT